MDPVNSQQETKPRTWTGVQALSASWDIFQMAH